VFLKPTILRNPDDADAEEGKRLSALSRAREDLGDDLRLLIKPKLDVLTIGIDPAR
jgi:hypothetical protein